MNGNSNLRLDGLYFAVTSEPMKPVPIKNKPLFFLLSAGAFAILGAAIFRLYTLG